PAGDEAARLGYRKVAKGLPAVRAIAHQLSHLLVSLRKRRSAPNELVGKIGGGKEALIGCGLHALGMNAKRRHYARGEDERVAGCLNGGEQRSLVLLQVAVVGERQALEQR